MNQQGLLISYRYDALDRLIGVEPTGASATTRVYRDGRMATQLEGTQQHSVLEAGGHLLAQSTRSGTTVINSLLACDQQGSVLQRVTGDQTRRNVYTPYGAQAAAGGLQSLMGFNGEQPDPVTGCYLLGNGYRAYNPVLMRFHSPDSMSPFDSGGINPYAYCVGDPVNMSDPTGHFSFKSFLSIVVSVAAIALTAVTLGAGAPLTGPAIFMAATSITTDVLGIASELASELAPDSKAGDILGYLSMGLSVASFAGEKGAKFAASRGNQSAARFLGKGAGAITAARQGASKVGSGRSLQNFSRAVKVGKAVRGAASTGKVLRRAKQISTYVDAVGYTLDGYDFLDELIGRFAEPSGTGEADHAPSTFDAFSRGDTAPESQGPGRSNLKPADYLIIDISRLQAIREF